MKNWFFIRMSKVVSVDVLLVVGLPIEDTERWSTVAVLAADQDEAKEYCRQTFGDHLKLEAVGVNISTFLQVDGNALATPLKDG